VFSNNHFSEQLDADSLQVHGLSEFFSDRVITECNELSVSIYLRTITHVEGSILNADFSDYLVCFNYVLFCCTFFAFYVCDFNVHH